MKIFEKKKKSFGFGKKNFGSDTDTFGFGRYRIPIPKFGRTLASGEHISQGWQGLKIWVGK
jgi:hypothetical protein